ncbi:ABC transporter ATP-binding protein [Oceanibacterium hippocampi]|uniref:Putative amino-acid import ATP-binding protein YxeO n=1 Tax=Oceanibacterium hippocampi TaxID=745714 RepID=A0A1Y5T9T4_9PROT|nr:ATP-binding cassette domain-containing protein [Oceanibacterium hippocampi]SLN58866.1 putative amino-acid import ATP-binding protein YxeO [Oceanibacterium hippocampi]
MSGDGDIKIRLVDVCKRFGDKQVLDHVSLDIAARRNAVLVGSAASGKSVLLKCLVGLHRPESGRVEIDGVDTVHLKRGERIRMMLRFGVLFQRSALFDSLPVWENIAFKLIQAERMPRPKAREHALEKLGQVGLSADVADLMPASLSGGMQKRVGLARAIAGDPEFLILDDPTAGLDPINTRNINRLINKCVDELGATALSVTGDMASAREEYDDLTMIHEGRVIWSGPTADIDRSDDPYLQQLINGRAKGPIKMRVRARGPS